MMTITKDLVLVIIVCILGVSGCKNREAQQGRPNSQRRPVVYAEMVRHESITSYIDITGSVQANVSSEVTAPVDGVIERLTVRENQFVEKGRIIAVINPNERISLIGNSMMTIQQLEKQLAEMDKESDAYQTVQLELDKAHSNLAYAENMFQTFPLVCPMSGVVTERWADEGSQVGVRDKIITISDMNSLVIKGEVNEKYFEAIKVGRSLPVFLTAYPNDTLNGRISLVYPQIDRTTRSVRFDVSLRGFNNPLLPGMMAHLRIPIASRENALTVAEDAVMTNPDNEYFLFVVDSDSIAHKTPVQIGLSYKQRLEIVSGLEGNENVVIMGQNMLNDSVRVQILTPSKADQR